MRLKIFSKKILILFLFAGAVGVILWPALFGGKVINDFFGLDLAHYKFTKDFGEGAATGQLKLWWQNYLGGFPVYLTQVGFFSPLVFIFYNFFHGFAVYNWIIFFNFVLAGLAMYWLARNFLLSKTASVISSLSYMLSQNHLYWGATLPFSNVYHFIPLFFLAILKISKNQKWWWLWGSLISAYGLAASETQIVFFTFVIGFFWALFLIYFYSSNNGSKKAIIKFRAILGYLVFICGGAILASFWLLPVLNYLQFTVRGERLYFANLAYDFMKIADPLRFFYPYIKLPQFTGLVSLGIVPNYYVGALTILLAIASIFLIRKNKIVAFLVGIAAFSILVRIKWTGIFWLLHFLPGFDRFRGVFHWAYIGSFALALLAGFALDNLEKIKESKHFKKFIGALKTFGWLNITVVTGIFLASLFRNQILNKIFQFFDAKIYPGKQLPLEHYHGVIASEFNKFLNAFSFTDYHFTFSFLSILIAILILMLYQKGKINFDNFKKFALVFTFFNLVFIWQGYYNFIPQSKITDYPDTVQFIKNQNSNTSIHRCIEVDCMFRFFRFYPPESYQEFEVFNIKDWTDYKLKTLESNIGVYFDMDTFGGVEPFLSSRIANIFDEIGFERPTTVSGEPWLRLNNLTLNQKISRFSSPSNINLLSMLNIKYVFSSFKLSNLNLVYETIATEKNIPIYIYENLEVLPRIYFVKNVKFVSSENAFKELLKVKDFKETTLIENTKSEFRDWEQIPNTKYQILNTKIEILEFEPQFVKIKTSGSGGWLVYSDTNLPTWEAIVDHQQTSIYTANYLFKSVFVPKGEHEIVFKYPNLWGQFKYSFQDFFLR